MATTEILKYDYVIDYLAKNNRQKQLKFRGGCKPSHEIPVELNRTFSEPYGVIDVGFC